MKPVAPLFILVGLPVLMQAQAPCIQEYKGEVMLHASQGKGVSKVAIVIDGNQGPVTDANGVFRYRLSKCPGMTVQIKLGNNNWAIVNQAEVYTYTLRRLADPADFQFKLIVAQAKEIEKARGAYYSEIAGVAVDKGLRALKGEIEKLKGLEQQQLTEQRLTTNQAKTTDPQLQSKVGELEKRLELQQKEYQRGVDSLAKEPTLLADKVEALQKILEKQRQENQQLLDSLAKGPVQQQGRIGELEQILERQRQENQQLLTKLARQDSTRQQDKTGELQTIIDQQKRDNKRLLDSLAAKELAWQKSRVNAPDTNLTEKKREVNQLRDSLVSMQNRYELALSERDNRLSEAKAMATVFAQQTEIDSSYQQAFLQYKEGQFRGALSTLSDEQPPGEPLKNTTGKQPNETLRERALYISKCLFKANIYRSQFDMTQAAHWYEEAIRADTTQVENILTYANFLHQQNRPNEPEHWYRKALELNPPAPLKGDIYVELGYYYIDNNQYDEAETALLEAETIQQQLARSNAEQYEPGLAHTLDGLGTLYTKKKEYDKAEKAFVRAKNIREKLVEKYADEFEADLAFSLDNLGTFYYINKRFGEAGKTYLRAKDIQDRLVRRNADQYEPDLAATLGNLGTLNYELDRLSDAETAYKQAKSIREKLVQKNPDQYEPSLAKILNDLGDIYTVTRRFDDAETAYKQAKSIRERLARKNPDQFESDLAQTLNDMGNLYTDTKRYQEAETAYQQARTIEEKLALKYADLFEPQLASTLEDLGFFYMETKRNPEAEAAFEQTKAIQEKLTRKNPVAFEPDLAQTLTDLGTFYFETNRLREAKGAYVRAKDILQRVAPTDGNQLGSLLIQILHRLALLSDADERENFFREAELLQGQAVELAEKHFGDADSTLMARELSNWSYHLLFDKKFAKAQEVAEKALAYNEKEEWVNANLAMAYLLQGKLEEAKALYSYLKDKKHRSRRYKNVFMVDLDELETAGITHPDIAVIRKLLN
jgi:tetratricopeptide (TPR) repeat protein